MKFLNRRKLLGAGLALALGTSGLLAFSGVGFTGAYLSDTVSATQTSSVAFVSLANPSSSSVAFSNLLPGTPQSRVIVVTNNGTVPEDVYYKQGVVQGLPSQDSTPSQLTVSMSAPSSGLNSSTADLSPQSVLAYSVLAPGTSFNLTITLSLALTAGGTYDNPTNWNQSGLVLTVPIRLVALQTGLGWQVIN
jgi:hypothetical protein